MVGRNSFKQSFHSCQCSDLVKHRQCHYNYCIDWLCGSWVFRNPYTRGFVVDIGLATVGKMCLITVFGGDGNQEKLLFHGTTHFCRLLSTSDDQPNSHVAYRTDKRVIKNLRGGVKIYKSTLCEVIPSYKMTHYREIGVNKNVQLITILLVSHLPYLKRFVVEIYVVEILCTIGKRSYFSMLLHKQVRQTTWLFVIPCALKAYIRELLKSGIILIRGRSKSGFFCLHENYTYFDQLFSCVSGPHLGFLDCWQVVIGSLKHIQSQYNHYTF